MNYSGSWERIREQHLHPPDWENPKPRNPYNLVVIGGGTAGLVTTAAAGMLGARVALIESHYLGGDCTNYGCVPSKALLACARAAESVRQAPEFGLSPMAPEVDFAKIMDRMRRLRAQIAANDAATRFRDFGADIFFGEARFEHPHRLRVGNSVLDFARAVIATGTRPAVPAIPGLAVTGYLTNETVFSLDRLPQSLIVIGGGPIGCELGQAFRRFGSQVTLVTHGRLLPKDDPDAAAIVKDRFEREGIRVMLATVPTRAEFRDGACRLTVAHGGREEEVIGDQILVAAGRQPNTETLQLQAAGVSAEAHGVRVDDRLRTTNCDIFAAGDVVSRYQFTHAAEAMARLVVANALFGARGRYSRLVIPWCTYTDPEVAHVGIDAEAAARDPNRYAVYTKELKDVDRAILDGAGEGFARIIVQRRNGRIAGATYVAAHAGESVAEIVLAMQQGLKISDLSSVIHPYPTLAEAFQRAADRHLQGRLRPWMKPLLRRYFDWRR